MNNTSDRNGIPFWSFSLVLITTILYLQVFFITPVADSFYEYTYFDSHILLFVVAGFVAVFAACLAPKKVRHTITQRRNAILLCASVLLVISMLASVIMIYTYINYFVFVVTRVTAFVCLCILMCFTVIQIWGQIGILTFFRTFLLATPIFAIAEIGRTVAHTELGFLSCAVAILLIINSTQPALAYSGKIWRRYFGFNEVVNVALPATLVALAAFFLFTCYDWKFNSVLYPILICTFIVYVSCHESIITSSVAVLSLIIFYVVISPFLLADAWLPSLNMTILFICLIVFLASALSPAAFAFSLTLFLLILSCARVLPLIDGVLEAGESIFSILAVLTVLFFAVYRYGIMRCKNRGAVVVFESEDIDMPDRLELNISPTPHFVQTGKDNQNPTPTQ